MKVVKGNGYSNKDEIKLIENLRDKIGHYEEINIEYVNKIPKTKNGKLRFVISEIE